MQVRDHPGPREFGALHQDSLKGRFLLLTCLRTIPFHQCSRDCSLEIEEILSQDMLPGTGFQMHPAGIIKADPHDGNRRKGFLPKSVQIVSLRIVDKYLAPSGNYQLAGPGNCADQGTTFLKDPVVHKKNSSPTGDLEATGRSHERVTPGNLVIALQQPGRAYFLFTEPQLVLVLQKETTDYQP